MNFIENYTETLKADLRHGIDNSVGKTNLRIDDFLAKSHGEIAKDLTNPRQWYHSDTRHELITLLKGGLPNGKHDTIGNMASSGAQSPTKTNNPSKRIRFNGSRRYRQKQKREKRSKGVEYAMPCPTPEQDLMEDQNRDMDGVESSMEVTATTPHDIRVVSSAPPPPHLNCPQSAEQRACERSADNGTVNSVQMREFLDGIVSRKHLNKADVELGEGFVLPSIPSIRADFLPHSLRSKHAKPQFIGSKKDLPIIDTTRNDAPVVDEHSKTSPVKHSRIPSKSNTRKDKVVAEFVIDEDSDFVSKAKAALSSGENSQYIDNWITTLKTQPRPTQLGSLQSPRKSKVKEKKQVIQSKSSSASVKQDQGVESTSDRASAQRKQAIRIPSAQIVCAPKNDIQCEKAGQLKSFKPALPRKHYARSSVNLFKKNVATSQLKLHVIEHEIDDLFNKDENLRKAVTRFPVSPRNNEDDKLKKEDNMKEMAMTEDIEEPLSTVIKIPVESPDNDEGTACSPSQPRAPSVVSIEFAGDQTPRQLKGFSIRPTSSCVRNSSAKVSGTTQHSLQESQSRKYPAQVQGKQQSMAHVTSLQVFSERKAHPSPLGRPYISYEKYATKNHPNSSHNSRDAAIMIYDTNYDKYTRETRRSKTQNPDGHNTLELSASQACLEFGIQPVSPNHRDCSTCQDLVSCYSNLSERGYYGDLDSECSDPDRMHPPDFL